MSMFVDGVRETARDCVANPAESQWKLLILNGQWWWPETLPNTRSRTRMRTLHSPKMGIKCRIFCDRSRTFARSCPQSCPHRSTVAYFGPCCLDGTSKKTATRGSRLRSELDFRGGAEIHGR